VLSQDRTRRWLNLFSVKVSSCGRCGQETRNYCWGIRASATTFFHLAICSACLHFSSGVLECTSSPILFSLGIGVGKAGRASALSFATISGVPLGAGSPSQVCTS